MNIEGFRRLLRWYPRWWRERNGEVLLGTLLSDAQRRGLDRPSIAERASAFVHGLGLRLDERLTWYCSALALAVSALGFAPGNWGIPSGRGWSLFWGAAAALLLGLAWLSVLHRWGLSAPRTLLCVLLLGAQVPLSVLAVLRGLEIVIMGDAWWSAPFVGADALLRISVLVLMVGVCFIASHGVLRHRLNAPGWLVVVLAASITGCTSAVLSVLPSGAVLPALLTVNWLQSGGKTRDVYPPLGLVPRRIFILAGVLASGGLVVALTGASLPDALSRRSLGVQVACVALMLMFLGWGLWAASLRRRGVRAPGWLVFALAVIASGCYLFAFRLEAQGRQSLIAVLAGGVLGAFALGRAVWLGSREHGSCRAAVLAGCACVAFLSIGFPEPMWVIMAPMVLVFALRYGQAQRSRAEPKAVVQAGAGGRSDHP